MNAPPSLTDARRRFHEAINKDVHLMDAHGVLTNSDSSNETSKSLSRLIAEQIGSGQCKSRPDGQKLGDRFEGHVSDFLQDVLPRLAHVRPAKWAFPPTSTRKGEDFFEFEQYNHLKELNDLVRTSRRIRASLGNDYVIAPDVVVVLNPLSDKEINDKKFTVDNLSGLSSALRADTGARPFLHASISCKWTLRSDRAQNARSEALNLIRNRKGRAPHIAVVTAEPLPSRLASLALGTGDIDCVYHFALTELRFAAKSKGKEDTLELLETMIDGKRLKDIADLPLDLVV